MMDEVIQVTTLHGVEIKYNTEKKQFFASVGGREIRKSSQREVEKFISKFKNNGERTKAIIIDDGWHQVHVKPIEVVGLRGSKVQYKAGMYMESENADDVYVYDEKVLAQAQELEKEYDAWRKRWDAFLAKAKKIDVNDLK